MKHQFEEFTDPAGLVFYRCKICALKSRKKLYKSKCVKTPTSVRLNKMKESGQPVSGLDFRNY